jgi:hypothetical protein
MDRFFRGQEAHMLELELWLLCTTLGGFFVGGTSISWARSDRSPWHVLWGRRLFIFTLLFLGGAGLIAAVQRADGLVPLGILAGLLVVAMLWESPPRLRENAPSSLR